MELSSETTSPSPKDERNTAGRKVTKEGNDGNNTYELVETDGEGERPVIYTKHDSAKRGALNTLTSEAVSSTAGAHQVHEHNARQRN